MIQRFLNFAEKSNTLTPFSKLDVDYVFQNL